MVIHDHPELSPREIAAFASERATRVTVGALFLSYISQPILPEVASHHSLHIQSTLNIIAYHDYRTNFLEHRTSTATEEGLASIDAFAAG